MTRDELLDELIPLFGEVYRLLLNSWSLNHKLEETNWASASQSEEFKLAEIYSLEALKREIILGLCRLDESKKDKWSFHTAKSIVSQNAFPTDFVNGLNAKVKEFRSTIGNFKNEHRNAYIAHQTKSKFQNQFKEPVTQFSEKLKNCVLMAVDIADFIFGENAEYIWKLPDGSEPINLRRDFEN